MGELTRALKDSEHDIANAPVSPDRLAELLTLIDKEMISGAIAKGVFEKMFTSGRSAGEIVATEGLTQIDDEAHIQELIANVMRANEDAVKQYRAGKTSTFGFLVGQVMKAASGKANPKRVNESLKRTLDALETENAS
jgi:aspartyl-tRNA(Asn)/glutamyl-tRNA(Gln) amidotransferase subunit B